MRLSTGDDDVLMVSRKGQAIRFHESAVRPMGRPAAGVTGMKLRAGDEVIACEIARNDMDLLVVTQNGYGKRTRIDEYPIKGRGGMGVKTVQLTEKKGQLAGALAVRDGYAVMLISTYGTVIRMPVDGIRRAGRSTQGVIVMRLRGDDEQVSTLAPVVESEDDEVALEGEADPVAQNGSGPVAAEYPVEDRRGRRPTKTMRTTPTKTTRTSRTTTSRSARTSRRAGARPPLRAPAS